MFVESKVDEYVGHVRYVKRYEIEQPEAVPKVGLHLELYRHVIEHVAQMAAKIIQPNEENHFDVLIFNLDSLLMARNKLLFPSTVDSRLAVYQQVQHSQQEEHQQVS